MLLCGAFPSPCCAESILNQGGSESDGLIPDYWFPELERGVREINLALMNAGSSKSAFLFYTDAHWNSSAQRSPALLKYLYEHTGMTKTFFGGDIVVTEGNAYSVMSYLWDWRRQVKALPNHHSVVGNHDDGNTIDHLFDEDYVYGYLLAAEETPDIVRGDSGLYYYIDSPAEKTRYIFLDTAFQSIAYSPEQTRFLVSALASVQKTWHIVVIAHEWYDLPAGHSDSAVPELTPSGQLVLDALDAYNLRRSGLLRTYTPEGKQVNVPYDFSDCKGKAAFCIGGHLHIDFDGQSRRGIPVILLETDSWQVRSGLPFALGTVSESAVSGVIADYEAGTVTIVRVGRGRNRIIPLP